MATFLFRDKCPKTDTTKHTSVLHKALSYPNDTEDMADSTWQPWVTWVLILQDGEGQKGHRPTSHDQRVPPVAPEPGYSKRMPRCLGYAFG